MSFTDGLFNNLRQKLDLLGYTQTLPVAAIPLVGALFEDVVRTTESLRDAKKQIGELLEEKSCWELGVEPYKCDNSRLLNECNELHKQLLQDRESLEQRICELLQKQRNLQADKKRLQAQVQHLQKQLEALHSKLSSSGKLSDMRNQNVAKAKKPFISTVRSGQMPPVLPLSESGVNSRCTKCNVGYCHRAAGGCSEAPNAATQEELTRLQNSVQDLSEHSAFYKRKVEARDREIHRLNQLLTGGRPPTALARDCCYKNVGAMSEDLQLLQRAKSESNVRVQECQDQRRDAVKRASSLEKRNGELKRELDELREAALEVETQANSEIGRQEQQLEDLRVQLQQLREIQQNKDDGKEEERGDAEVLKNKRRFNERLNELTQRETELKIENEHFKKKIAKLKAKIAGLQKELKDNADKNQATLDEDKIRLKSERDFFQKEYLRLLSKAGSEKEVDFLQAQIKSKDEELRLLRTEICMRPPVAPPLEPLRPVGVNAATGVPSVSNSARSNASDCVQAVIMRAERDRDCARAELERVRCERDTLREKNRSLQQLHSEEEEEYRQRLLAMGERLKQMEWDNHEINALRLPAESQVVMLRKEIDTLKERIVSLQEENNKTRTSYSQLQLLHEQAGRSLTQYQTKLGLAEAQLSAAEERLNNVDSSRETSRSETVQLREEVVAIKKNFVALEVEKDNLLMQLEKKTMLANKLEAELRTVKDRRIVLDREVAELETQLETLRYRTRERDAELHETSSESKTLKQQLSAAKTSRDEAIAENSRLSEQLADSQAEVLILKKKLKESDAEIDRMKQQLRQYVQEVKKAEDLLMRKEKEREEMLEHYRSLSQDAVMLEGNNQSLEVEAAECKRQICELETENEELKKEICCRNSAIAKLEDKIAALSAQSSCLERQLEEAIDEQRLLKVDLSARKELCEKLDIEKDKLNAELAELNEIRKKLEKDNEKLRRESEKVTTDTNMSEQALEELLARTRRDLEDQIRTDTKLSQELLRLRTQNQDLLKTLDTERQKRQQQEALSYEYQVQNQELRHNMTDDRFRQARSREQSPRFPTQTL